MESLFSSHAQAPVKASRFTWQGNLAPTREEGGKVGLARDPQKVPYIVHTIGRQLDAIPVHCVVTALASEAIPMADVVKVMQDAGKLDALAAVVKAAQEPPKAAKPAPAPAGK